MKISKAKEIITLNIKEANNKMPPDVYDALILALYALTRLQTVTPGDPDIQAIPPFT